jgi:S-disulfanyl-L-cysteine oxidoreductase SoxD
VFKSWLTFIAVSALAGAAIAAPRLGEPASPEVIARADISIPPDGSGLPPGSGTVAEGLIVYRAKCQSCHGEAGAGGPMDRLTGGVGSLTSARPVRTMNSFWPYATTAFDYIRRAMPLQAPQSLTSNEVYAVTAYLLSVDGIVPSDARLNAATLPKVRMPNRDGLVSHEPSLRRPSR